MPKTHQTSKVVIALLLLAGGAAGRCDMPAGEKTVEVVIDSFMFMPATVTIKAGTTVTWINNDEEAHTVVGDAGLFRSGALDTSDHFAYQFREPGTYHYTCSLHARMVGTVIVQ